MKLTYLVPFALLSLQFAGSEAFTQSLTNENPRQERRQLRIIPTLLQKILDILARFHSGIFADLLFGQAPSDAPSMTPSDVPTNAPSATPNTPSAAPFSWNDVLGDKSHGFETCPSDPKPIDLTSSTELNVMYAYQLELTSGANVLNVTGKIEALLQETLAEQVCMTSTDTLGIASDPVDSPGAICPSMSNGTCYVIAGRLTLLVAVSALADVREIYCEFLEAIRDYLSGDDVTQRVGEVATINSTILESLVPTFCTIRRWRDGVVSQVEEGTTSGGSNNGATKTIVLPIVLSLLACTVAMVAMFLYLRHRSEMHNAPFIPSTSTGSDLNFENSDASESQANDTKTPSTAGHPQNAAELSAAAPQLSGAPILFSPANFAPPTALFSPTHTEQEIIFSPSSSVASSVLFRSP